MQLSSDTGTILHSHCYRSTETVLYEFIEFYLGYGLGMAGSSVVTLRKRLVNSHKDRVLCISELFLGAGLEMAYHLMLT